MVYIPGVKLFVIENDGDSMLISVNLVIDDFYNAY